MGSGTKVLIAVVGVIAFGAMMVWAVAALRSLRRGGSGLPYLAMPNPLPDATRQAPVVCLGHSDPVQAPVLGNGGLWMSSTTLLFHSAAGTIVMNRPLRYAQVAVAVPEIAVSEPEPVLEVGFTTSTGGQAVAAFRSSDAIGWAVALRS